MLLEQKAIGLCYHSHTTDEFGLIREAGFDWLRMGVAFPWKDRMHGELSESYLQTRRQIELASQNGVSRHGQHPPAWGRTGMIRNAEKPCGLMNGLTLSGKRERRNTTGMFGQPAPGTQRTCVEWRGPSGAT